MRNLIYTYWTSIFCSLRKALKSLSLPRLTRDTKWRKGEGGGPPTHAQINGNRSLMTSGLHHGESLFVYQGLLAYVSAYFFFFFFFGIKIAVRGSAPHTTPLMTSRFRIARPTPSSATITRTTATVLLSSLGRHPRRRCLSPVAWLFRRCDVHTCLASWTSLRDAAWHALHVIVWLDIISRHRWGVVSCQSYATSLHMTASLGLPIIARVASGWSFGLLALQDKMLWLQKASLYEQGLFFKSKTSIAIVVMASLWASWLFS